MGTHRPSRPPRGGGPALLVALLLLGAALAGILAYRSSAASPPVDGEPARERPQRPPETRPDPPADPAPPSVANLDPDLRAALDRATADAAIAGVAISVTSGWRSPQHQEALLRDAIARYGSAAEAARWVATPATSAHVSGDAVDVGPEAAMAWLARHGAAYGLCRVYDNEPWHFELRPGAAAGGCPPTYPDPTFDPRMRG